MMGLLGRKKGMTEVFGGEGESIPVTVVEAGPCRVIQRKTRERDGYDAIQLGLGELGEGETNRPLGGHFKKHSVPGYREVREFRLGEGEGPNPGELVTATIFKAGERIDVTGTSKGKGFQGVIKRHGKSGGPASHGSRFHRSTGSIGQRTSPGEVFKNMKLPGHLGMERVTVRGLEVIEVRENLLFLRGAVPGSRNGFVILKKRQDGA